MSEWTGQSQGGVTGLRGPSGTPGVKVELQVQSVTVSLSQWTELELNLQESAFLFSSVACFQKPRPKPTPCLSRLLISRKESVSVEI